MIRISFTRAATAAVTLALPLALCAQQGSANKTNTDSTTSRARALQAVTVTATRQKTNVHDVPTPVSVIDSASLREKQPNTAADLLREMPGTDVIGVGTNQQRPSIRGQRGQRILLLEDGLRLNNARRQQDFGELPALVDVSTVDRVEVVRGPASVLYGSDAIGGVINLITRTPSFAGASGLSGRAGYRFGSAGDQSRTEALLLGHNDHWAFELNGAARVAGNYDAPAGSFGKVTLKSNTTMLDGGVRDHNVRAQLGWRGEKGAGAFLRTEQYAADDAGFGYVPPSILGGDPTQIRIRYPRQNFQKLTTGWQSGSVQSALFDRVDVLAYGSRNKRDLAQDILVPAGPNATIGISTANFTDLATVGGRVEATKVLSRAVLTYGVDFFNDRSEGTDSSLTTIIGFGPTMKIASNKPQVPNASLTSYGVFVQANTQLTDRLAIIAGGRFQDVTSNPRETPGRTVSVTNHNNSTTVYAVNSIYRATDDVSLVASVGRGFRWPNLVERYFDGPTPEGSAYQVAAPDLQPETSVNFDLGAKVRMAGMNLEAFIFQSKITDGIQTVPTGAKQSGLPVYQNTNVAALRTDGAEIAADVPLGNGITAGVNWSTVKTKNVLNPTVPVGDTYSQKLNLSLGWRSVSGRFWGEYAVRHNGEQKDIQVGASAIGPVLPAFTTQLLRAGVRGWAVGHVRQDLSLTVNNVTNVLYAEAANSTFFRPEPGRSVMLSVVTSF